MVYNFIMQPSFKKRKAADVAMEESHQNPLPDPWEMESPMTKYLLHDNAPNGKASFHCLDVWHSLHLGVGKAWAASGVMQLQRMLPESNVDLRIAVFATGYREFCKRMKLDPVIRKIDVHTFGGGGSEEPNASWNKAWLPQISWCFWRTFCPSILNYLSLKRTVSLTLVLEKGYICKGLVIWFLLYIPIVGWSM